MLSNTLHHFSVTVVTARYISFALGEMGSEWGEEHPAWQPQAIQENVTENNLPAQACNFIHLQFS